MAHEAAVLREFADLLSIPNLASDNSNIRRNANALVAMLEHRGVAAGERDKPGREFLDAVAVAHPDGGACREPVEQRIAGRGQVDQAIYELVAGWARASGCATDEDPHRASHGWGRSHPPLGEVSISPRPVPHRQSEFLVGSGACSPASRRRPLARLVWRRTSASVSMGQPPPSTGRGTVFGPS